MNLNIKKKLALTGLVSLMSFISVSHAHDAGATLGDTTNFLGMATVTCFNDDEGVSDRLEVKVKDLSPPVDGLLVNVQIFHLTRKQANTATDAISGDAEWSPTIAVQGGSGGYGILVSKTAEGPRQFQLQYHCMASDGVTHTGTDISVNQFGLPSIDE